MDMSVSSAIKEMLSENKICWAAGFADGEACIRIHKQCPGGNANPIYSLEFTISQNCLETLQHFKNVMGIAGSIYVYPCKGKLRRPVYALTYRCTRARVLLVLLLPHLVRKRKEALLGIEFSERASTARMGRRRHSPEEILLREDYYKRMKNLK
jgi:hypothetical protein